MVVEVRAQSLIRIPDFIRSDGGSPSSTGTFKLRIIYMRDT